MEEKLKISVFRHKTYKNVYLVRNWCICGACSDTYRATSDLLTAIENANQRTSGKFNSFFRDTLTVKYKMTKPMEFDGYSGILEKEVELNVTDFEEIILTEE